MLAKRAALLTFETREISQTILQFSRFGKLTIQVLYRPSSIEAKRSDRLQSIAVFCACVVHIFAPSGRSLWFGQEFQLLVIVSDRQLLVQIFIPIQNSIVSLAIERTNGDRFSCGSPAFSRTSRYNSL